jgi:hypothetical protein
MADKERQTKGATQDTRFPKDSRFPEEVSTSTEK